MQIAFGSFFYPYKFLIFNTNKLVLQTTTTEVKFDS